MKAKLVVVKGAKKATIQLNRLPTVIGRVNASVTVPDTAVSRRHCELFEDDGDLHVRDLGSSNGTFVNNEKIDADTLLDTGDLLKVGPVTLRIVCEEQRQVSDDSFIDLDAEMGGGAGESQSFLDYRETPEGSFISIDDEKGESASTGSAASAKKSTSSGKSDVLTGIGDEPPKKVESGDSALNDFFKNF